MPARELRRVPTLDGKESQLIQAPLPSIGIENRSVIDSGFVKLAQGTTKGLLDLSH